MQRGGEGGGAVVNEAVKWAAAQMRLLWGQRQWWRVSARGLRQKLAVRPTSSAAAAAAVAASNSSGSGKQGRYIYIYIGGQSMPINAQGRKMRPCPPPSPHPQPHTGDVTRWAAASHLTPCGPRRGPPPPAHAPSHPVGALPLHSPTPPPRSPL